MVLRPDGRNGSDQIARAGEDHGAQTTRDHTYTSKETLLPHGKRNDRVSEDVIGLPNCVGEAKSSQAIRAEDVGFV